MNLVVHEVGPPDLESWRAVVSWVYDRDAPVGPGGEAKLGEKRFLVTADGDPAGACSVADAVVARGQDDLRCGAVAAVATLVQHRRSGVADALMRHALSAMRDSGQVVSALYAFRESYYRRFGYASCGWRWRIKCPRERLPRSKSALPVRQIDVADVAQLDPVYSAFVRQRSGSFLRTEADWHERMGKRKPSVYAVGDPLEGYLWANFEGFWGEADIGEMAWSSPAGYEGCLSVLASICSNQEAAVWSEPPDSPYIARHLDQGAECTLHRPTMFRVVDVRNALRALSSGSDGRFTFHVDDPDCPWNNGPWSVSHGREGTTVEQGGEPSFRMGIPALTQAVLGSPGLQESARSGLVQIVDHEGFEAAQRFFGSLPVVCMDFF